MNTTTEKKDFLIDKKTLQAIKLGMKKDDLKKDMVSHLRYRIAKDRYTATDHDKYLCLAYAIRDRLMERWIQTQQTYHHTPCKRVYYLSLEYLTGRTLGNAILNLGLEKEVEEALYQLGLDLEEVRQEEPDAGLGNGGLGRLAACFLDSLATLQIPCHGYGIRYEYGIFKQTIMDGFQVENPDAWLHLGNPWEIERPEFAFTVKFGGHVETYTDQNGKTRFNWIPEHEVTAIPFDTPVPGYKNNTVNTLRLWSSKASNQFDLDYFNHGDYMRAIEDKATTENISKVLYPNDNNYSGLELRVKQQYFFVSASLHDILRRFKQHNDSYDLIPEQIAIQLNDTHPAVAIPEFMRLLIDEEGLEWDHAWGIITKTFAYTNHTLLPEALETWPVWLYERLLPRHTQIIFEINRRFLKEVALKYPGDNKKLADLSIIQEGGEKRIRMAYLSIVGSHSVNGVAALHTELLKNNLVSHFYELYPEKFNNKTNGITQRRWLRKCNPELSKLITEKIGEDWVTDLIKLKKIEKYKSNKNFVKKWQDIKKKNKEKLAQIVYRDTGTKINPDSIFDVQVKRIHEYKRQLLLTLFAIDRYQKIKDNPDHPFVPRTILIGGKAAPGYTTAKLIIKLINNVGEIINQDPDVNDKLKLVFLPNYRVSLAEKIIPATDLSEQISTAGKEASGTGNMKFALNGALTIGTLDGANVEIREEVGDDNIFIFGLKVDEVETMKNSGYNPMDFIQGNESLQRVLHLIECGFFSLDDTTLFKSLVDHLKQEDTYMLMADFEAYIKEQEKVEALYLDQQKWTEKCITNVANMGFFSSDRTIGQYVQDIWGSSPVPVSLEKK